MLLFNSILLVSIIDLFIELEERVGQWDAKEQQSKLN